MRIKLKCDVKEDSIHVEKNAEGIVKACCIYESKGYFYLVQFPDVKIPILVNQNDAVVISDKTISSGPTSQMDKAEEEFLENKKQERKLKKQKHSNK